jgi:hypothetical protein
MAVMAITTTVIKTIINVFMHAHCIDTVGVLLLNIRA